MSHPGLQLRARTAAANLCSYIYVSLGSCLSNFNADSKCFAAFLSKIWVVSLHYVCSFAKLYMELVYPIIDYCSVCSSGAAHRNRIGYSTSIFRNHNLDSWRVSTYWLDCQYFFHISMHHAGPSSSTLYQNINLNSSDKQQPEAWLA